MIPQLSGSAKARRCSETCLDLLAIQLVRYYQKQKLAPAAASIEAIGNGEQSMLACRALLSDDGGPDLMHLLSGFRVGRQLVERYTQNRPRLGEHLDVIKFVCKEFWADLFGKTVDNLRTNHRGTFVLKDNNFRWVTRLSTNQQAPGAPAQPAATELAKDFLVLPCAIVRGALCHLGVDCSVSAECTNLPACDFTITLKMR